MIALQQDWITTGWVDFEYKKYMLLGYLQNVKKAFGQSKLYPHMADLVFHYRNLMSVRENKHLMYQQFPQTITKANIDKLKISYKKIVEDDEVMRELEDILQFAIPQLKGILDEGKDIYQFVEENMEISAIGLLPLYNKEGYLLINEEKKNKLKIFQYQITVFDNANEKLRGVNMTYLEKTKVGFGRTLEQIKLDLLKKYKTLPNPATYAIQAKMAFPFKETILPISKRLLVSYINSTDTSGSSR